MALKQTLNLNLYHSLVDNHFIGSHAAGRVQSLTSANIKPPTVPVTLDHVLTELAVCQRRTLMWAEILGGIVFAIDIVKGQLAAIEKLHRGTTTRGYILDTANSNGLPLWLWSSEVADLSIE